MARHARRVRRRPPPPSRPAPASGQVLRALKVAEEAGDLAPFEFVELNGMRLTDPANAYSVLCEALTGKRLTPAHAAVALEKHFSVPNPRCAPAPGLVRRPLANSR